MKINTDLIPIIGLEIHVELRTKSKMFCGCPADHFGKTPNTQTCPVCLGLPGALPVPNLQAIHWTMMVGKALGCKIALNSKFDRKHYFYPDLPKGYQISQYDEPLCYKGLVKIDGKSIRITRVHLEEDTGKLQHQTIDGKPVSLVDYNRSGVPLVEIVTEPDIHSAAQAKVYAAKVREIINFLGVSDADMEKGSMRLEANISLSTDGSLPNYKVEVKNINSFRFLEKAINFELKRQEQLLKQGITPVQETRGFSESSNSTVSQRSKEEAKDYRYFPEPDIPPMRFSVSEINKILAALPKLPDDYYHEFTLTYKLKPEYAAVLISHRRLAEKAFKVFALGQSQKIPAQTLANLLINRKNETKNLSPSEIIKLSQPKKSAAGLNYPDLIQQTLAQNPEIVAKYRSGKTNVIGVLIGQAMKLSHGQANPVLLKPALESALK